MSFTMTPAAGTVDGSLDGVVVARTALAFVDGRRGIALVRGYSLAALAARGSYDDIAHLVLRGELPSETERTRFRTALAEGAVFSDAEAQLARALATGRSRADALAGAVVLAENNTIRAQENPIERAERVLGRVPSVCAAVHGYANPPTELSYAHRALRALGARREDPAALRAFETLLCLEAEHGLSASTFACRVAGSSGANAGVSLAAAVATLSGPRHGGATAEARGMLLEAHASGAPAAFLRDRHAKKARLPGFGHRIYKVPDPRVPPLLQALQAMGDVRLLSTAETLDREAVPLYGSRGVYANIDLYGAVLLDALGVDSEHYVAAFALGLACGWLAHWHEQQQTGRLVRPESEYTGPEARSF